MANAWRSAGYKDSMHGSDRLQSVAFPPVLAGDAAAHIERSLSDLHAHLSQCSNPGDYTACVALQAFGLFVLGRDAEVVTLGEKNDVPHVEPLRSRIDGASFSTYDQHYVAAAIMSHTVYGLAKERLAAQGGNTEPAKQALLAYERAATQYDRLRGTAQGLQPEDEVARWAEQALYRRTFLAMRLHGVSAGMDAFREYHAAERHWPSGFRAVQRSVIATAYLGALNLTQLHLGHASSLSGDALGAEPAAQGGVRVHTVSTRRPNPAALVPKPSAAWSQEVAAAQTDALKALNRSTDFPRADEVNTNPDQLAEQVVLSWWLNGAQGGAAADQVVELLYSVSRVTFRSPCVMRLLVAMLAAAEAYAEATHVLHQYVLLVERGWEALGGPITAVGHKPMDTLEQFVDTVLLGAHLYLRYLNEPEQADKLAARLLDLVGLGASKEDKEEPNGAAPRNTQPPEMQARVLRCAGRSKAALAMKELTPVLRPEHQRAALAFLQRSVELDPEASESHYALACVLAQVRDVPRALRAARRALELEPASLEAWHLVVLLLTAQKDIRGALGIAEEALDQADSDEAAEAQIPADGTPAPAPTRLVSFDYPPTPRERSESYVRLLVTLNMLEEANAGVSAALASQKQLFEVFHVRLASSAPEDAGRVAVPPDAAPDTQSALRELTETPAAARRAYRALVERRLLVSMWLLSAASFRRAGDLAQARAAIQEAETVDASSADVWAQLAQWCIASKEPGTAVTCLYKALACDAEHVPASVHLAELLLEPHELRLKSSHADSIAAAATAPHGSEALTRLSLIDAGSIPASVLEDRARSSGSRSLAAQPGAKADRVDKAFAWQYDPHLASASLAEALLRTATLYRGWDVPEAWYLLSKLSKQVGRSAAGERRNLLEALRLEETRPIRPLPAALALP